jgi:predicted transcriptional regulator
MKPPKKPPDPRGGWIRLYWEILDSMAWRVLSHADVRVYIALRRKLLGSNNGNISAVLSEMKQSSVRSSSTLATALHRLEALGLIEKTRQGGIANGGKLCCLYRFTDEESYDHPKQGVHSSKATNEWKTFKTLALARAAIKHFDHKNMVKVRKSKRTDSITEASAIKIDSTIEQQGKQPLRSSKRKNKSAIAAQAL